MEHFLSGSVQQDKGIGLQGYDSSLLDVQKPATIQVNASGKGLRAALL